MSQTPQDSAKNEGPAPQGGRAVVVTVVGLMVGVAVLLLLMVLRTNERGGGATYPSTASTGATQETPNLPPKSATNGAAVATSGVSSGPAILISNTAEIKTWMTSAMKATGAKVALVNVWATWCGPCRDEMPELAKFQKLGKDPKTENPVPVFLVSADNQTDVELARSFLASAGVDFESVLIKGDQQIFIETWADKSSKDKSRKWSMTLPVTFVIDANAEVLSFHVGTSDLAGFKAMVKKAQSL